MVLSVAEGVFEVVCIENIEGFVLVFPSSPALASAMFSTRARLDRRIGDKANGGCAFDRAGSPAHRCRARHGGQAGRERVHARQQHQERAYVATTEDIGRLMRLLTTRSKRSATPKEPTVARVRHRRRNSRLGAVPSRCRRSPASPRPTKEDPLVRAADRYATIRKFAPALLEGAGVQGGQGQRSNSRRDHAAARCRSVQRARGPAGCGPADDGCERLTAVPDSRRSRCAERPPSGIVVTTYCRSRRNCAIVRQIDAGREAFRRENSLQRQAPGGRMVEIFSRGDGPRPQDVRLKAFLDQNRATIAKIADHLSLGRYSAGKRRTRRARTRGKDDHSRGRGP